MQCTRQATSKDSSVISRLRINEFKRSKNFDLLLTDKLRWSHIDDEQTVLAVWGNTNKPISTMRAVVVYDVIDAQECLQCLVPNQLRYPAMVFNAAATRKEHRGQGLNQVIRYHYLQAAIRDGIEVILSPIYVGAPRIDFMKALGYEFVTPEKNWQTKLLPKSERILGILPSYEMRHAIDYLKTRRREVINAYPWKGESLRLPVKKPIKVTVLERKNAHPAERIHVQSPDINKPVPVQNIDSQGKESTDNNGVPEKKQTTRHGGPGTGLTPERG